MVARLKLLEMHCFHKAACECCSWRSMALLAKLMVLLAYTYRCKVVNTSTAAFLHTHIFEHHMIAREAGWD